MPYDVRDHYAESNKAIAQFQREVGTIILWWEFDSADTTEDDLYDEGSAVGQRRWYPPKKIPVYSVIRVDRTERPHAEGFYDANTVHFSGLVEQWRRAGLTDPHNSQLHLFDRVKFGDAIYEIRQYQIHGRLHLLETTVGVDATQVNPEEVVNDPDFTAYFSPPASGPGLGFGLGGFGEGGFGG